MPETNYTHIHIHTYTQTYMLMYYAYQVVIITTYIQYKHAYFENVFFPR